MPRTRTQRSTTPPPAAAPAGKAPAAKKKAAKKKKKVAAKRKQATKKVQIADPPVVVEEPPAAPPSEPTPSTSSSGLPGSSVQPSIQGMTIAQIRAVRGEQRRKFEETGYVDLVDEVAPGVLRIEFNNRYAMGILNKRLDKHRRASAKKGGVAA